MKEPVDENGRSDKEQAENLVPAIVSPLRGPSLLLGDGLKMRLDAGFYHVRAGTPLPVTENLAACHKYSSSLCGLDRAGRV